jgi:hypothetical protein
MLRRLIVLCFAGAMFVSLGTAPAEAHHPRGDIYEQGAYDDPYQFEDDTCGFPFEVKGRATGYFINYNVPGSDGQAFLNHDWYRFWEVLTNPANGKRMYLSGRGYFREVAARHVEGDIWEFDSVETGSPFVVRDARGRIVLMDRGKIFTRAVFDTLGDSRPGAEFIEETFHKVLFGSFPSREADFDFCAMVSGLIG